MVSEGTVRLVHAPLLGLITLIGIVTLAMSASLVAHYNSHGYPNISYRDRIRIILAGSIWSFFVSVFLVVGVAVKPDNVLFGIFAHIIGLAIAFILLLIGVASLTALTDKLHCSGIENFSRCKVVKGLVGVTWTQTVLLFIALIFVFALGVKARSGGGMRRSTLVNA
ncbi:BZ3500_MvSof-1268-A1-R1_Chr4-4g07526 [Microbotryum saponariae]|uniref:BZ3500_MvSof-1268-A1-R1_Chr4-4g07526 protein n=1 Tax=Microbotryum saponariae TaxID=289078 RepID=A0A2X0MQQ1_9BASI|nr:BZ3500_MvSof-1268-A1-R1_Chr4-4g07526 [Microbotryum saponariae]SDA07187.1 BZ3501_MvSof-1269-A2-R1_Chr4-3g07234 [Microbotryum saponariae]